MAKENIDHTFRLVTRRSNPDLWKQAGRGVQPEFCKDGMVRQFGKPPEGTKTLFFRLSSKKPRDKAVQWWPISFMSSRQPQDYSLFDVRYRGAPPSREVKWAPGHRSQRPGRCLFPAAYNWMIKNFEMEDGDLIRLWCGCWVEE